MSSVRMRSEITANKPPTGPFDVKLGPGGLVDLEFALQVQQLRHGVGLKPRLGEATSELVAAGLAPADIEPARILLTRLLVTLRLVCPSSGDPAEASRDLIAHACRQPDWNSLLAAHDQARQTISSYWADVAAEKASW